MEVIVGKYAGFCPGVMNSVTKAQEAVNRYDKLYCLGELIHNKTVVTELEEKGIVGPSEGAKPRAVLISKQQWYEQQALANGAGAPSIDDVFADDDDFAGSEDEF